MHVCMVGINFQTAHLALREKAAISTSKLADFLKLLYTYIPRGVILSTCNRTEVYSASNDQRQAHEAIFDFFGTRLYTSDGKLPSSIYSFENEKAVEHLFRVAGSLESMIVGEYEVLGQVKHAMQSAEKAGMLNLPLRYVFQSAVRTGRCIRQETAISKNALSVSSVAVDLAAEVVGNLKRCRLLIIGAGEAGELVAKIAQTRGISHIAVASRTQKRAKAIATECGGIPIGIDNLNMELSNSDIVVTCSGAPHRILDVQRIKEIMKNRFGGSPLVIIDIGVPRNTEPAIGLISNVSLYNIDDILQLCEVNRHQREDEVQKAELIIAREMQKFSQWWYSLEARPLVTSLMSKAEKIRSTQLNKTLKKLPHLSEEELDRLDAMTKSIVTKILKDPIHYLKANQNDGQDIIKDLFQLDIDDL